MVLPLLTTKLYFPPVRPELVPRPQLVKLLNAGIYRKLTLVSAPAGFGKTTLVNTWLRSTDCTVTWLSLDEEDNDLVRFLHYLVAAFYQIDDGIGPAMQPLLDKPQLPHVEYLLTELINNIASLDTPFVLVLDDYHVITALDVQGVVNFLLERQPPSMHLVIISRQDPSLSLSRMRARDQVTEIRQRDLRFTSGEITDFLNQTMDIKLSASEVAALEVQTEGWISGLQMAALALQSRISARGLESVSDLIERFSGRHQFILGYLTDEVLEHQPDQIYSFLLYTSVLKRMCAPLCDALVEQVIDKDGPFKSSQDILDYLQRKNLFVVSLDEEGRWYRYHRLFAELLRARLQAKESDCVPDLYHKASAWCEQNGLLVEAVNYALEIPDYDLAAGMIESTIHQVSSWTSVNVAIFQEWLKVLPVEIVRIRPRLRLFTSRVYYLIGQREETEKILKELEDSLSGSTSVPDADEILGSAMADRASYAAVRGEVQQAVELANRARKYLPDHAGMHMRVSVILGLAHFRGGKVAEAAVEFTRAITAAQSIKLGFVAAPIFCNLAEVQIVQGQLRQAYQTCQNSMEKAIVNGAPTSMAGFPGLELGKILYEQNNLPEAERYVTESLTLLNRSGTTDSFGRGHALLARIKQARGDSVGALTAVQRAIEIANDYDISPVKVLIHAYQARIWLLQNKLELAVDWMKQYKQLGETEYIREFEDLTLARVLIAQNTLTEALELLNMMNQSADSAGRVGTIIEILTVQAVAFLALGNLEKAIGSLKNALQMAESQGYVRVFINEGSPVAHLLKQASNRGILPNYVNQLLKLMNIETDAEPASPQSILIEQLSSRELEVLELLAGGLTNLEITQQLFISLPTVKSHARNIYSKLGVHNRTSAVKRARELGILPS